MNGIEKKWIMHNYSPLLTQQEQGMPNESWDGWFETNKQTDGRALNIPCIIIFVKLIATGCVEGQTYIHARYDKLVEDKSMKKH